MQLHVKLISDMEEIIINETSGRTLEDLFLELTDNSTAFLMLGKRIVQKSSIEYINAE
ncbi:hypothetical protein [Enterococcus mediterraneensis]|uniref:hypothetical protein n=1 Tax=Enterococcus mediterraneensis TaxID=2364791 RepID=UPI0013E0BF9E|nr:hypothetical protein [Enterococcus mediterraneensis]